MGDVTKNPPADFGSMLRAAREAKGVSLKEIAESTKISTGVLEALETNDVGELPGGIFTRSFVRSYAGAVGLDPEEAVRAFLDAFPTREVTQGSAYADPPEDLDEFASQRLITRTAIGLFALSIPVAALLVFLGLGDSSEVDLQTPEAIIELGPPRADLGGSGSVEGEPLVQEAVAVQPLVIDIHPREACWVSLSLDGRRVFSRVMQPGEREVHEAAQEIVLNVGNAGVFNFSINQEPGQSLGAMGEVVTAHIDRHNYRRFVMQQAGPSTDGSSH